jgi:hypothetical protein
MKKLFPLAAFCLLTIPALAANHYIRSGATGNGSGSDWINACTDFTGSCAVSSLVRGDTYYVASGRYAARSFNATTSGTLIITVKGATTSDHGTDTGWQSSFSVDKNEGGAQAHFGNSISFGSNYWVFDGAVPSAVTNDPTAYGFTVDQPSNCNSSQTYVGFGSNNSNVTVAHLAAVSCGSAFDVSQDVFQLGCGACNLSNIKISHVYSSGHNVALNITNTHDSIFEYVYMENSWSTPSHHGDTIAVNSYGTSNAYNNTLRYSVLKDCTGTGGLIALGPGNTVAINNWDIYGNVFYGCGGGNGSIAAGGDNFTIANTRIYNNTFGRSSRVFHQCNVGAASCPSSGGNVIKNNVVWNGDPSIEVNGGGAIAHDYNTCISVNSSCPSESHIQSSSDLSGTNTFLNASSGNFRLKSDTVVATGDPTINSAPYNFDMDGDQRGLDGTWARGAFEFNLGGVGGNQPPNPPQGLSAIVR